MSIKIALAGNPNSGKTTLFNALTGSSQYVGNWPGVTVEKKEGKLKGNKQVTVVDLPGIYSLSPYTLEEVVSRNFLIGEAPDVIINIVDATNIERNLYLTTQLAELGIPVLIALNMTDILNKRGEKINEQSLAAAFGCEVMSISALKGTAVSELSARAVAMTGEKAVPHTVQAFSADVEAALTQITELLPADEKLQRFYAIKLFERDEKLPELSVNKAQIESIITRCEEIMDDDSESIITNERYQYITDHIKSIAKKKSAGAMSVSDKIDRIVTNRILALPIFAAVMFLIYFISVSTVGTWGTDWVNEELFGSIIPPAVEGLLESVNAAEWLSSLILDGIIGGVGAVLGFLPQMLVLFFLLAILEDCGYMARIAFVMDRIFRKFGLSGKSFIPILIGTGCGVPGIMASRTIENERDRRMTIITTTFIPCGAKLPIIALIAGALFSEAWWVGPSCYFIGIAAIICSGIILKKTKGFAGEAAPFVMELPAYHVPGIKGVLIHMWERGKSFVVKAGTIIFLACGVVWFLSSFSFSMEMVDAGDSMLAKIGSVFAPLFAPLGWGHWEAAVAAITGLVAKENVVGTFGVLYGYAEVAEDGTEIWGAMAASFTQMAAYSFLAFNLLCAPCFAAIGAIRREMSSAKWTWFAIGFQTGLAYIAAMCIYQIGTLITKGTFGAGVVISFLFVAAFLFMLFRPAPDYSKKSKIGAKVKA